MLLWMSCSRILRTYPGLKPNLERIATVKQFATPRDVKTVKQFLGLASFYHKLVPNFTRIAEPLHKLTRKSAQFDWTTACQDSFNCMKKRLIEDSCWHILILTRILCSRQMQGWEQCFPRSWMMGSATQFPMLVEPCSPKNVTVQLQKSRHLQLCGQGDISTSI